MLLAMLLVMLLEMLLDDVAGDVVGDVADDVAADPAGCWQASLLAGLCLKYTSLPSSAEVTCDREFVINTSPRFFNKGRVLKKDLEKVWSFANPPLDPPSPLVWSFFYEKYEILSCFLAIFKPF